MAESRTDRRRRARRGEEDGDRQQEPSAEETGDGDRSDDQGPSGDASPLSARELTQAAMSTVAELTGFEPESASALEWDGEAWLVTVDVLEMSRIPNTTDVLGTYVVQLDPSGELEGYRRTRRFVRGQVEGE